MLSSAGDPGVTGSPASMAALRAVILSPKRRICSAVGPIKVMPCFSTISAKSAFSDKNPYPGWMASAPVISAAEIIAGLFRYESDERAGPMQTASSARRTCIALASASECTATVLMPISLQALWILKAISPRLAIKTFSNIRLFPIIVVPKSYSMTTRGSPYSTGSPVSTRILTTLPPLCALTGLKVFIASTRQTVSPSATVSPGLT